MLHENTMLVGSYDYRLVVLSVVIAAFASYAALELAGRVMVARGWARFGWLAGGASAMGLGVWSMHYIGMLAFRLSIPVWYDWPIVLLSLLTAILAAGAALHFASGREMSLWRTAFGSLVMGGGIGAMHYIGMDAMRMSAMCHFNPSIVVLSVMLAVGISFIALRLLFLARSHSQRWKFANAIVMGAAIPIMHYTGMAAVSFTISDEAADLSHAVDVSSLGVIGIATLTILILGIAILTTSYSRLLREPRTMRRGVVSARIRALRAAMATFCVMLVFEAATQSLHPKITIWTSHAFTISFTTGLAAVLSFIILRKEERLRFELTSSEAQYRSLVATIPEVVWKTDIKGNVIFVSPQVETLLGYSAAEFCRKGDSLWFNSVHVDDKERVGQAFESLIKKEQPYDIECRAQKKNGEWFWAHDRAVATRDSNGARVATGLISDISVRKAGEESERRYRSLFESMLAGFAHCEMVFDDRGRPIDFVHLAVNSTFEKLTGLRNVVGRKFTEIIPEGKDSQPELFERYVRVALTGIPERFEIELKGLGMWFSISAYGAGKGCFVTVFDNITERKQIEAELVRSKEATELANRDLKEANQRITQLSRTDALTGLANRRTLEEVFVREASRAERQGEDLTMMLGDLDHFKSINDQFGHLMGDQFLVGTAAVLGSQTRPYDLVVRFGGEEFVVLLPGTPIEKASAVAERIRRQIQTMKITGCQKQITISLGLARWRSGDSLESFLARADTALYQAKRTGRNKIEIEPVVLPSKS